MDNLYLALIVKLGFSLIPFMFLGMIYNKEEIECDEHLNRVNKMEKEDKLIESDHGKDI